MGVLPKEHPVYGLSLVLENDLLERSPRGSYFKISLS